MMKLPPIFGSSLVILALVTGVVLAVQFGWVAGADIYVEIKLDAPQTSQTKIKLPVRLTLKNPSGRVQYLEPQSVCRTFRWFVLDERAGFVQSAPPNKNCIEGSINRGLKAWEEAEEDFILELDRKRYKQGKPYFLILKFWGKQIETSFTPLP